MKFADIVSNRDIIKAYKKFVPIICDFCGKEFDASVKSLNLILKKYPDQKKRYCNRQCATKATINKDKVKAYICANCGKPFDRYYHPGYLSKNTNKFCNSSCATRFNNRNKKTGVNRSKFEFWLEGELLDLYPDLDVKFNARGIVTGELDIYLPHIGLAFEINGIHHYRAIYGKEKLLDTQRKDRLKQEQCTDLGVELHVIDISGMKRFTPEWSMMYLQPILDVLGGI